MLDIDFSHSDKELRKILEEAQVIAIVGEALTRARRSARKAMVLLSWGLPTDLKAMTLRCEDAAAAGSRRHGTKRASER